MENILLFLISKITINIDFNKCIKYIINNTNIKTTTKYLTLILEIIILIVTLPFPKTTINLNIDVNEILKDIKIKCNIKIILKGL